MEVSVLVAVIASRHDVSVLVDVVFHNERVGAHGQHGGLRDVVEVLVDGPEVAGCSRRVEVEHLVVNFLSGCVGDDPSHEHAVHRRGVVDAHLVGGLLGDVDGKLGHVAS